MASHNGARAWTAGHHRVGRWEVPAPDDTVQAADLLVGASRLVPAGQLLWKGGSGRAGARPVLCSRDSCHLSRRTTVCF